MGFASYGEAVWVLILKLKLFGFCFLGGLKGATAWVLTFETVRVLLLNVEMLGFCFLGCWLLKLFGFCFVSWNCLGFAS